MERVIPTSFSPTACELDKYVAIFSQMPAAIALIRGPTFIFEMVNESYLQLVGRTRQSDLIGKDLLQALPELLGQPFPDLLKNVFETGDTFQGKDVEAKLKLDRNSDLLSTVYLDIMYRRILDSDGKPYGIFVYASDVTEKVLGRLSVQVEQQKLEAVFGNASASLAILSGTSLVFEKANSSYVNLFNGREIVGKPLMEALPELHGQKFPDLLKQVFHDGIPYVEREAEAYLRRTSTSPVELRYFDQSYTRILDKKGMAYGVLIQAIDVTDQVHARKTLQAGKDKLEETSSILNSIMTTSPDLIYVKDRSGRMRYCNPITLKLIGTTEEALYGKSDLEFLGPGKGTEAIMEVDNRIMTSGVGETAEERLTWPNGSERIYMSRKEPYRDSNGLVIGLIGISRDITGRKETEAKLTFERNQLETIFQQSPAAMVLWKGVDMVFEKVNPAYQAIFPDRKLVGKKFLDACPEFSGQSFPELLSKVLKTGKPFAGREVLARHADVKDGPIKDQYYDFTYLRINDSENKPYGVYSHAINVTDRVLDKQALSTAIKGRDELLSICSHELRTPIASMKLSTQMFKRGLAKKDPEATSLERIARMVEQSDRQLDRLTRLIDEMLDFSRINGGMLKVSTEEFDMTALVRETIERITPQFEAVKVSIQFDEPGEIEGVWDRFRLEQVITNLLSNALKYGSGKPVRVALAKVDESILISVSDQGLGIPQSELDRIFKPYERAVSVNNISGLGLGLYISSQIVEAHTGTISVESEIGKGSTFSVRLPLSFEESDE